MGLIADEYKALAANVPAEDPSVLGELSKGISRGGRHTLANLEQAAGLGAEALGYNSAAQRLRGGAEEFRTEAAAPQFAPEAPAWNDVHGVGQGLRWAAGKAGEMIPIVGGAAVGGMVAGPVGAGATMLPDMVGQIDQGQQADPTIAAQPVGERGLRALGFGAAGAGAMMLPVGGVLTKFMGRGAAAESLLGAVGRNVGEGAVTGYAGMGAADVATQKGVDPTAAVDWGRANEAGIGGAVAMGAMHAPGAVPAYFKGAGEGISGSMSQGMNQAKLWGSKKVETMRQAAEETPAMAEAAGETAGKQVNSFYDDISSFARSTADTTKGYASSIMGDKPLGVDMEALAKATPEQAAEMLKQSDQKAAEWASTTAESLMKKAGLSDESRAKLAEAMNDLGDHANRAIVAGEKLASDAADSVGEKIAALRERITPKTDGGEAKKSEDYSGVEQAVLDGLMENGIVKRRPDIFGSRRNAAEFAGAMRQLFDDMSKGPVDGKTIEHLNDILGVDATPVLNSVKNALGRSGMKPSEFTNYLKNLNKIDEVTESTGGLHSKLGQLLTEEKQDALTGPELKQLIGHMTAHARGEHMTSPDAIGMDADGQKAYGGAVDAQMRKLYAEHFGDNASKATELIQEHTKLEKGTEHTGSKEYTDDGEEVPQGREAIPRGQNALYDSEGNKIGSVKKEGEFDAEGNRLTAEDMDVMKFGLSAPDKAGNQKMRRNGRQYLDPDLEKARGIEKSYTTRHLMELRNKYPDKLVNWEGNERASDANAHPDDTNHEYGHITVSERPNPENVTDESVDSMKLDTHKYPNSKSRLVIDTGAKTEKGEPKPLILDTLRIAGTMRGRLKQGAEPDMSFAHTLKRGFIEGIAALTDKFGVNPQVPDEAVIGFVGGKKFTWGMAQKLEKGKGMDSAMDGEAQRLSDWRKELYLATVSQADLAAHNARRAEQGLPALVQKNLPEAHIKELQADIKYIEEGREFDRNKELVGEEYDPRAAALRARDPNIRIGVDGNTVRPKEWNEQGMGEVADDGTWYPHKAVDERSDAYDKEGRLTNEGLRQMLEGDYHGGIEVGRSSSRAEEADRVHDGARFMGREFDGGTGQTEIGKDAQVHTAFAGGRDAPYFGRERENSAPQQHDNIVRSNQDGTPHFVSDRWSSIQAISSMGHELKAKSSVIAKGLGDKIVALTDPSVLARMHGPAIDALQRASLPGVTNSSRTRLLNMLTEDFITNNNGEQTTSREARLAAKERAAKGERSPLESTVDYSERHVANQTLVDTVDAMSDRMAAMELGRRERLLAKVTPGSEFEGMLKHEIDLLKDRIANGRPDTGPARDMEYTQDKPLLKYKRELDIFGKANKTIDGADGGAGMYDMARVNKGVRASSWEDFAPGAGDARSGELGFAEPKPKAKAAPIAPKPEAPLSAEQQLIQRMSGAPDPEGSRVTEGLPGPKAVAAKKAALTQAASSSDPALHEQLASATDAKSLQRTVEHLADTKKPNAGTVKAIDIANKRMGELVGGSEDVGYGLQRKHSLERVGEPKDVDTAIKGFRMDRLFDAKEGDVLSHDRWDILCQRTSAATEAELKRRFPSADVKVEMMGSSNPGVENARDINHYVATMKIDGRTYLFDQPQRELVRPAGEGHFQLVRNSFEPRAIEKTPENLMKEYGLSRDSALAQMTGEIPYNPSKEILQDLAQAATEVRINPVMKKALARAQEGNVHLGALDLYARGPLRDVVERMKSEYESQLNSKKSMDSSKPSGPEADAAQRSAVEAEIKRIAPQVSVAWKGLTEMPYAGDYNHAMKAIRLSVHALNPMGTGYHESLHHFFASLRDGGAHDVADVVQKAAGQEHVIRQLNEIYKGNAEVLKQLADPEERAAYMFQHWATDPSFKVSMKANSVFGKIKEFVNELLGQWSNSDRALHIMKYFKSGEFAKNQDKPSVVRRAVMEANKNSVLEAAKGFAGHLGELADSVVSAGSARMRDSGIPALGELADTIKRRGVDGSGGDRGYIQAARIEGSKRNQAFMEQMTKLTGEAPVMAEGLTGLAKKAAEFSAQQHADGQQRIMSEALEALQRNEKAASPEARIMVMSIKKTLKETREYMVKAGVDVGDLGPDYFHRVWDTHYIAKNQQAFRDMLEPYIRSGKMKGTADQLLKNLTSHNGTEFGLDAESVNGKETLQPGMQATKRRVLDFLDPRDAAEFLNKDLMGTMSSYTSQAVRKAEWSRRLGGGKLEAMLLKAKQQGATPEHLSMAEDYLKGIDGTLGDNISATQRRLTGNMIVYQNVRLLPMASFSMLIDPLGTVVRGAKAGEALETFKRGIKGIAGTLKKNGGELNDDATHFAELTGVVDSAMMSHAMGDAFTQGMVGGSAKTINDTFFKYNLVEGLNRNFRIGATESAMKFIQRHGDGANSQHSARWIKELGLEPGDIKTHEGRLALTEKEGLTKDQVTKVHAAINQWVDGAILRPDAADKPIWMNDPHYALIAHLKQFVYSFQHTILERVGHEFKHGNYTPAMALASYVPVMMAADMAKGILVNGGDTPDWQKGWTMADYVEYGIERSGIYGVGQFGLDVAKDIHRGNTGLFALSGPSIEQLRDAVETIGGHKQFGNFALDAMPANAAYSHYLGGQPKDVMFAD